MNIAQQRAIAHDMHDHPAEWRKLMQMPYVRPDYVQPTSRRPYMPPRQPDRIDVGTRRYYPIRYEQVYQWCVFVSLAAILILGLIVLSLW